MIFQRPKELTQKALRRNVVESEHRLSRERRRPKHAAGEIRRVIQSSLKRAAQLRSQHAKKLVATFGVERCFVPHSRAGGEAIEVIIREGPVLVRRFAKDPHVRY